MKRCNRIRQNITQTFFAFSKDITILKEVIHQRISWNPEKYLKIWANMPKKLEIWIFNEKGASDPQNLREPFFAFSKDITMLKNWFISAFPEIEKIVTKSVPQS